MISLARPKEWQPSTTDVKGDGNCFWYSLEALTKQSAKHIKSSACSLLPQLKPVWLRLQDFYSEALWEEMIHQQDVWHHSANEVTVCAASIALDRVLLVVSDAALSLFSCKPLTHDSVKHAMIVTLHGGHYQYSTQQVPEALIETFLRSPQTTIPSLKGGGVQMCSWNIGSLHLRWQQLLTLNWQLVCPARDGGYAPATKVPGS